MSPACELRASAPSVVAAAFRPAAVAVPYLEAMDRSGYDPFRTLVDLPQWRRIWVLWRGF